jgi:signal transduction histidine kinase
VRVSVQDRGKFVAIAVADSGPGIAKELREKIMQPFFTTKKIGHGTGLGLSISKSLIEDHGGCLLLDPDSQQTRFFIYLPKNYKAEFSHLPVKEVS